MRTSRFSDEEIITILNRTKEASVTNLARQYGVTAQTIYHWQRRYQGFGAEQLKTIRVLVEQNQKLDRRLKQCRFEINIMERFLLQEWGEPTA